MRHALRERALDVRDWIDLRPDPSLWPVLLMLLAVPIAYIELPNFAFWMAGAVAAAITLFLGILALCAAVGHVLIGACCDVAREWREHPRSVPAIPLKASHNTY